MPGAGRMPGEAGARRQESLRAWRLAGVFKPHHRQHDLAAVRVALVVFLAVGYDIVIAVAVHIREEEVVPLLADKNGVAVVVVAPLDDVCDPVLAAGRGAGTPAGMTGKTLPPLAAGLGT